MATLRDRVIIGAISGAAAILTRDVYSIIAKSVGVAEFYVWWFGASLFLKKKAEIQGAGGIIVGIPADLIMGAIIGVGYVYFLKWTQDKNPILKGLGVGLAAWLLVYGFFWHNLPFVNQQLAPGEISSNISALIGHALFGTVLGVYSWFLLRQQGLVGTTGNKGQGGGAQDDDEAKKRETRAPGAPSSP